MALNMQPYLILPVSDQDEQGADAKALASANKFQATVPDDFCFVFYINMKHNKIGVVFSDRFYPYAQRLGMNAQVLTMSFNDLIAQQIQSSSGDLVNQVLSESNSMTSQSIEKMIASQLSKLKPAYSSSELVAQVVQQLEAKQPKPVTTNEVVEQVLKSLPKLSTAEVVQEVLRQLPNSEALGKGSNDASKPNNDAGKVVATIDQSASTLGAVGLEDFPKGVGERQRDVLRRQRIIRQQREKTN